MILNSGVRAAIEAYLHRSETSSLIGGGGGGGEYSYISVLLKSFLLKSVVLREASHINFVHEKHRMLKL